MQGLTVQRNQLMLLAGLVWCVAGLMVAVVGGFVFSRLVRKHTSRVRALTDERLPFWRSFDRASWVVMAVMISAGMGLRLSHTLPDAFIAFFYSGLGIALFLCGVRFLTVFARKTVRQPEPVLLPADRP